jgi:dTDP-4-dehydrorhamnose reductase
VEKLLVTRTDTLIGANAVAAPPAGMELVAVAESAGSSTLVGAEGPYSREAALCDAIRREQPHMVLHAGPTSWSGWDSAGTDGARIDARCDVRREIKLLNELARACDEAGSRLVVATTDALFAGPRMFHPEQGQSWATTPVARAAKQIEQALIATGALVLRGHVYGWMPAGGATNYAERMFHALTAELPYRVDARRHASPILATDFVRLAQVAARDGLQGLYNLSGAERTSPYRFAAELAAMLGVPGCNVRLESNASQCGPYRDETSLAVGLLRDRLKQPLPLLREGLGRFVEQAFNGYRGRLDAIRRKLVELTPAEAMQAA